MSPSGTEDWEGSHKETDPPSGGLAPVILIAINVAVSLYVWITVRPERMLLFLIQFGLVPAHFQPYTLITSMFLHAGLIHLIGNMYFLGVLGGSLDGLLGRNKFLILYLGSGIIAGLAHFAANSDSVFPMFGASGAVAGLMGATVVKFPTRKINLLALTGAFWMLAYKVEAPAGLLLIAWLALQAFWLTVAPHAGVAWIAHIGGFGAGVFLVKILTLKRLQKQKVTRPVVREDWQ